MVMTVSGNSESVLVVSVDLRPIRGRSLDSRPLSVRSRQKTEYGGALWKGCFLPSEGQDRRSSLIGSWIITVSTGRTSQFLN